MDRRVFDRILEETVKAVNGFKVDDWKNRELFQCFNEFYNMVDGYSLGEEQKKSP